MTDLAIHPLTPDRWDDFVALFESDSICRNCWCAASRLPGRELREMKPSARKARMAKEAKAGRPPGLLAYHGDQAVGWLAVAPRSATPDWNVGRKSSAVETEADATDPAVWATTCFFVHRSARKQGITGGLLAAGIDWAKANGAMRLEACPMSHDDARSTVGLCVGPKRVFERAGFETVLERKPGRPLMRLALGKSRAAKATKGSKR